MVKGINYVVELHHKGRSIRPKVVDVDELRLTGEGDVPLTTRLGGITATAVVDGKLDAFLAGVADYRDVALELYFTVGFDAKLNLLFSGVADRGGWEREKTPTGERIQMAFVTALGAAEPVDLNDATTARAYDTMPYGDAITLIARAAGVDIKGSLGDVDLNNFSTVRRVRRDLGDAQETYDAADEVRAVAVLPDGAVAVGCGKYVLLYKGRKWYAGAKLWYDGNAPVPFPRKALHDAAAAGGWTVLALGYHDDKLYGIAGSRKGACAAFSFAPAYGKSYNAVKVTAADLYWWWWDRCEVFSFFTEWRSYNTGEEKVDGFKNLYTVGYPVPDTDKTIGGLIPPKGPASALSEAVAAGATTITVFDINFEFTKVELGDHVEIRGFDSEYAGTVLAVEIITAGAKITVDKRLSYSHGEGAYVWFTHAADWPRPNVKLARPSSVTVDYVNALVEGGTKRFDVGVCYHCGPESGGVNLYRPLVSTNAPEDELEPCFIGLQADPPFVAYKEDEYRTEMPRQFLAYVAGRSGFAPDVAGGWAVKQSRASKYHDQGDVRFYKDGAEVERGDAQGAAIQVGDYLVKEAVVHVGTYYFTALKIQKYAPGRNAFDLVWQSRDAANATSGTEYYLTSEGVKVGDALYFGVRARERIWVDLDNAVCYADVSQVDSYQARGAIAIAVEHHVGDYVDVGDYVRVQGRETAFRVLEFAEIYRDLSDPGAPFGVSKAKWEGILQGGGVCPDYQDYVGPLTVIILYAPDLAGAVSPSTAIRNYFCGKKVAVSKRFSERAAVLAFDVKGKGAAEYPVKYNPATAKVDEAWKFATDKVKGETLSYGGDVPPAFALFKAKNERAVAGTATVLVDGVAFDVEDVTAKRSLPAPWPQYAYVDYAAGDDHDELWIYLDERYGDAEVIAAYDYYPDVEVTAVWEYDGAVYYATSDGYIWRLAGASVGKCAGDDAPIRVAYGDDYVVYFITRRGCLAQFGPKHSGAIEGEFGGDDTNLFKAVAEIARAAMTPLREEGCALHFGRPGAFVARNCTRVADEPVDEFRAVEVSYSGGKVGLGDATAPGETIGSIKAEYIYTPQLAAKVAARAWEELRVARRDLSVAGKTDELYELMQAGYVTFKDKLYRLISAGFDQNEYDARIRSLPAEVYD